MYVHAEEHDVEDICFDEEHIRKVVVVIENNFDDWFDKFLETGSGTVISDADFEKLREKFHVSGYSKKKTKKDRTTAYKQIIANSIDSFEKDRDDYLNIFDLETLEEYEDDITTFKSKILRDKCPIIRKTIQNRRAKQLDKYRADFNRSNPQELLQVVTNLCEFEENYKTNAYEIDTNVTVDTLGLGALDTEEYTVYGVIGGGIKSHMLYKVCPGLFPNRSQFALWALWFLTGQEKFDCKMDSEFLMIDPKKCITQQNYFYPYGLFSYYAYVVYMLLKNKADELGTYIDESYRYVIVDAFLSFISEQHSEGINMLISQIREEDYYYA